MTAPTGDGVPPGSRAEASADAFRGQLQLAGIGLLLAGIANAVAGLIWIGQSINTLVEAAQHSAPLGWLVVKVLLSLSSLAVIYYTIGSALFLLHREDDGDITFPLVIAAIIPPGCLFGLPAAIYAMVLLSKPEVKALFPKNTPAPAPAESPLAAPAPAKPSPRVLLSAFLALLFLFGFFFAFAFHAEQGGPRGRNSITIGALDPLFTWVKGPTSSSTGFNFISWSFLAAVVAGVAISALWRVGREDQGKAPRDPAWWRDWWKQVGVWGGLLLIACVVRTAMNPETILKPPGERGAPEVSLVNKLAGSSATIAGSPKAPPPAASPLQQPFMIGTGGPELTNEAVQKLKLSKLQADEINRILLAYHREYLALQRRHSKVGKDGAGRIFVTIEPFDEECLALARRLETELGGIVDPALLPVVKDGELPFAIFAWGGACNETIALWKADGKYQVEEKLTSSPGHERDPYTFNMSGPKLEEIPEQFRIFWREE
ncbi:MAG: hypothetical protein QOE70_3731 [Chthoniobacter sp.]|nr:hypothetical protein [Chthoniobacter sp.]